MIMRTNTITATTINFARSPHSTFRRFVVPKMSQHSTTKVPLLQQIVANCKRVVSASTSSIPTSTSTTPTLFSTLRPFVLSLKLSDFGFSIDEVHDVLYRSKDASNSASPVNPKSSSKQTPPIRTVSIYTNPQFELSLFILPKGSKLPLHNHPCMSVMSRCIFGQIKVYSYDWEKGYEPPLNLQALTLLLATSPSQASGWHGRAKLSGVNVLTPDSTTPAELSPSHQQIHEIVALEDSVFFDIITPPYYYPETSHGADETSNASIEHLTLTDEHEPPAERRHCHYYEIESQFSPSSEDTVLDQKESADFCSEHPFTNGSTTPHTPYSNHSSPSSDYPVFVNLKESLEPSWLQMYPMPYRGPKLT